MNAPELITAPEEEVRSQGLLNYYEAIEHASQDMLDAARAGDWDTVVRLEGACAVLIARLKLAASEQPMGAEEPWINDLSRMNGHPDSGHLH